jgi:hypothetical protein
METHLVVGYQEVMGCYDYSLHKRVIIHGDVQRLVSVCPIIISNLDELDGKHPQRHE